MPPMKPYFPEVVEAVRANLPQRCVVDGEIVLFDPERGALDFEALQLRLHPAASRVRLLAEQTPASFVVFDLLADGDDDLTARPFAERRRRLEEALADATPPVHLTPMTDDEALAQRWFDELEGAGLDGLIAKSPDLTTFDGHPWDWAAHEQYAEATPAQRRAWGSRWNAGKDLSFVPLRPELVVETKYDYLEGGRLRHTGQFVRWRPDRDPRSCTWDQFERPLTYDLADLLG